MDDMQQIDLYGPFIKCLSRLARQTDHGGAASDPEQVWMADVITRAVRHHQAKRLEWLSPQCVAQLFRGHLFSLNANLQRRFHYIVFGPQQALKKDASNLTPAPSAFAELNAWCEPQEQVR